MYLYLKTHLLGNNFLPTSSSTSSHVWFWLIKSILDLMACSHVSASYTTISWIFQFIRSFPDHSACGTSSLIALDDDRLIKYTTVCNASAQNSSFSPKCWSIVVTLSMIVQLIRSATPFCMEVYGTPLSDLSVFTLCPGQFSTSANHREKTSNASSLNLIEQAQTVCVQSSTNVIKYRGPPSDLSGIGPHISMCTSSRGRCTVS